MVELTAAVIGLGSMGLGAALSLARAGIPTHGFDLRPQPLAELTAAGGHAAASAAEAAAGAQAIFVFVVNAAQAEAVLFGPEGAVSTARPGSVFVLCPTLRPDQMVVLCDRLVEAGMLAIDAPVSGGAQKARDGQISIMASGPDEAFTRIAPALQAIAAKVFRLGDAPGAGSRMKVINQLLAGVHIASMAEAMVLAAKSGMDLGTVQDVITECAGSSWMFENRGPQVVSGDYTPFSAVDIFVKDLGIVAETAEALKTPVPQVDAALKLFNQASAEGLGGLADAAVAKVLAAQAKVRLPGDDSA
ncbi:L-threonate dehydrogenase [Paracoccus sulfuroxidans]|uniref:L-threonate dehydrogenase n=1 Tax=Paracoccus sulfuroxidans TaxID=384678 RepID=A0A562NMR1_9RHOB|nr:L-threonate dehydrogenase [Paracoccus sulfuroxidans]TWI33281.1 3-hydroxyisobutyrate dehydrogenase [Paracoccus sulfuroxidans]